MTTIYLKTRPVKRSRNLRGILDYARVSPVQSVDCQRVRPEPFAAPGTLPIYSVMFTFDNGALGQTDWADWRVLVQWLKARRSWDVQAYTGLLEFTYAMTRTDPPPGPVYGLKAAYRPYACQCCGTVQNIQTNHTGPLSGVCGGCNGRALELPTTGHAPYGGRFPRALAYAGPLVEWPEINRHAIQGPLEAALDTYSLDSIGGQAIAEGWLLGVQGQPAPARHWPYLRSRGFYAGKAALVSS